MCDMTQSSYTWPPPHLTTHTHVPRNTIYTSRCCCAARFTRMPKKKKLSHVTHGAYPCATWLVLIRDTLYTSQVAFACNTWLLYVILTTSRNMYCHVTRGSTWHILIDMTHSYRHDTFLSTWHILTSDHSHVTHSHKWSLSCDTF